MACPASSFVNIRGPYRAGMRVMGQIPRPCHTQPNSRELVPLALPNAQAPAIRRPGQPVSINRPIHRNLFPGRVQTRLRPNGW